MSVVAILGSGFGLYGYLPAMVEAGAERIVLPVRYQAKLSSRPELARFSDDVQWAPDESAALVSADSVVVALRPDLQAEWVSRCLKLPNIERLLLEKPLAPSPDAALSLFEDLVNSRKVFRIGYVFRFTPWGGGLLQSLSSNFGGESFGKLRICWSFLAHHFLYRSDSWKRYCSFGGGAVRFYGIHLIALLAELGYTKVSSSQTFGSNAEEIVRWSATFSGRELPDCDVVVDTKAMSNQFRIERLVNSTTTTVVSQVDPFGSEENTSFSYGLDKRVSPLACLCRSLWGDSGNVYGWYRDTIILWCRVEDCTSFEVCPV